MTTCCTLKQKTAILSTSLLSMKIHLPDAECGLYRGPRFDWSGQITQLQYSGHSWFSPWMPGELNPVINDHAVIGTGGEFGRGDTNMPGPLAYESAKPGDTFL